MMYFKNCTTAEELKKAYRELAKKLHPDCGGDPEVFKAMTAEFEKMWEVLKDVHATKEGTTYTANEKTTETAGEFMNLINALLKLDGVIVEVCGRWIWCSGRTYDHRQTLKAYGFQFSKKKVAWYYHRDPYKKYGNHVCTMAEIREMYGSKVYTQKAEESEKIAAH